MAEIGSNLDELAENFKEMISIIEKQEKRVRYLETQATKLVISYVFFQGILFLSISHSSRISCNNWWYPFYLSLSIAFIFGLTFASTITKWERIKYQYELNLLEQEMIHYKMYLVKNCPVKKDESGNMNSDQSNLCQQQGQQTLIPDMVKVYQRYAYIFLMAFVLLGFTFVILRACCSILCDGNASAKP